MTNQQLLEKAITTMRKKNFVNSWKFSEGQESLLRDFWEELIQEMTNMAFHEAVRYKAGKKGSREKDVSFEQVQDIYKKISFIGFTMSLMHRRNTRKKKPQRKKVKL
jgi:hypothetical protein